MFWGCLKSQIVCSGAKIVFLQNCQDVKNEVFEKKLAFSVFAFYVGERQTAKKEEQQMKFAKVALENSVLGVVRQISGYSKAGIVNFEELQTIVCVWRAEKMAFSSTLSVLEKLSFLVCKNGWNATKIGASAGSVETKNSFLRTKGVLEGVSKRLFTTIGPQIITGGFFYYLELISRSGNNYCYRFSISSN